MSNLSVRLKAEPVRTIAFGSILAAYAPVGTAYDDPVRIYYLQNLTDATLMFSWDGVNDHFPLPSTSFLLIDVTSNKSLVGGSLNIAQGDRTYVKRLGIPTIGNVYLTIFYGSNG